MLLEIKCPSCGNGEHVVRDENEHDTVYICKNEECSDFNCFWHLGDSGAEIKEGLTGSLQFEDEDGTWYEEYENGKILFAKKID